MSGTPILAGNTPASFRARSRWRLPLQLLASLGAFLYWGVFGLLLTLISPLLRWVLPQPVATRLGRSLLHQLFLWFSRYLRATGLVYLDVESLAPLREISSPVIIAPNHFSILDAVFLISCLPQPICIMKESILHNPFLGGGARLAGYISTGPSSRLVRDAAEALSGGGQLLLFPEGTRTHPEVPWINPLKGGCALIARHSGAPIFPVFIRGNSKYGEKGRPLWKLPEFPLQFSFELGAPIRALPGESARELTARLEQIYVRNLSRAHKLRRRQGV